MVIFPKGAHAGKVVGQLEMQVLLNKTKNLNPAKFTNKYLKYRLFVQVQSAAFCDIEFISLHSTEPHRDNATYQLNQLNVNLRGNIGKIVLLNFTILFPFLFPHPLFDRPGVAPQL